MADVNIKINAQDNASTHINKTGSAMNSLRTAADELKSAIGGLAGSIGIGMFLKSVGEAALATERLDTVFKVATGSASAAAKEMQFIREQSNRLGLDMNTTADSYSKFLTALKGTSIEGEVGRQTFIGISEGMAALKKTGDESSRVFAQVQQSMSKGKIELEDMKIIAEAGIPIFKLLADSMGKSTQEVMKMMSDGKLMSSEVWPKVAEEMHKAFGPAALEAAKGAQAEFNRFKNAVENAKKAIGETLMPTMVDMAKGFTWVINSAVKPLIGGFQMMAVEVFGFVDKAMAVYDAGGIIGILFDGQKKIDVKAKFAQINQAIAEQKQAIFDKLNPNVSSQKTAEELNLEKARNAAQAAKDLAEKAKADRAKIAEEVKALEEQQYKNELQALQISGGLKLETLKNQFAQGLVGYAEYFDQVKAAEEKSYTLQVQRAEKQIQDLKKKTGTPGYTEAEKKLGLEKDILAAVAIRDKLVGEQQMKEIQRGQQLYEQKEKEKQQIKEYNDLIHASEQEIRKINGADADLLASEDKLYQTTRKKEDLQEKLNRAIQVGNTMAIQAANSQIAVQDLILQRLSREIELRNRVGELTGAIVGYNGNTPIYADSYQKEQAANGYVSNAQLLNGGNVNTGGSYVPGNVFPSNVNAPFLGGFATGTNYIPQDGLAYLHEGEAVVPKKYNHGGSGVSIDGGITVNVQGGGTSIETAKEAARMILPEINKLMGRYRMATA